MIPRPVHVREAISVPGRTRLVLVALILLVEALVGGSILGAAQSAPPDATLYLVGDGTRNVVVAPAATGAERSFGLASSYTPDPSTATSYALIGTATVAPLDLGQPNSPFYPTFITTESVQVVIGSTLRLVTHAEVLGAPGTCQLFAQLFDAQGLQVGARASVLAAATSAGVFGELTFNFANVPAGQYVGLQLQVGPQFASTCRHLVTFGWGDPARPGRLTISQPGENQPPTAAATATPNPANAGDTVSLSSAGSNDDRGIVQYVWTQDAANGAPPVSITGANQASASFAAPDVDAAMDVWIVLTVRDAHGATGSATIFVGILPREGQPAHLQFLSPSENATVHSFPLLASGTFDASGTNEAAWATQSSSAQPGALEPILPKDVAAWFAAPFVQEALGSQELSALQSEFGGLTGFLGVLPSAAREIVALFEGPVPLHAPASTPNGWPLVYRGGVRPELLDGPDGPHVPGEIQAGIGPGSPIRMGGGLCSASYLFRDLGSGKVYLSTAGHCLVLDAEGADSGKEYYGEAGKDRRQGTVRVCYQNCVQNFPLGDVLGSWILLRRDDAAGYHPSAYARNGGIGGDFGLIEIPPEHHDKLRPWLSLWGGPRLVDAPGIGDVLVHYGHGAYCCPAVGAIATRTPFDQGRIAVSLADAPLLGAAQAIFAAGWASGGDSGSAIGTAAVRLDRLVQGDGASGVLTHGIVVDHIPVFWGTHIEGALARVASKTGFNLGLIDEDGRAVGQVAPGATIRSPADAASVVAAPLTVTGTAVYQATSTLFLHGTRGPSGCADASYFMDGSEANPADDADGCGADVAAGGTVLGPQLELVFGAQDQGAASFAFDTGRPAYTTLRFESAVPQAPPARVDVEAILESSTTHVRIAIGRVADLPSADGAVLIPMLVEAASVPPGETLVLRVRVYEAAPAGFHFLFRGASRLELPLHAGLRTVEVSLDDPDFEAPTVADGSTDWTAQVDLTGLVGGHTIHVRALRDGLEEGVRDEISVTVSFLRVRVRVVGPLGEVVLPWTGAAEQDGESSGAWSHSWAPTSGVADGLHRFEARLEAGDAFLAADARSIQVVNRAPTATVAPLGSFAEGTQNIALDGSGSTDPDGDALSFMWRQTSGASGVIVDADQAAAVLRAPSVFTDEVLGFELVVTDGRGGTATHVFTVGILERVSPRFLNGEPVATVDTVNGLVGITGSSMPGAVAAPDLFWTATLVSSAASGPCGDLPTYGMTTTEPAAEQPDKAYFARSLKLETSTTLVDCPIRFSMTAPQDLLFGSRTTVHTWIGCDAPTGSPAGPSGVRPKLRLRVLVDGAVASVAGAFQDTWEGDACTPGLAVAVVKQLTMTKQSAKAGQVVTVEVSPILMPSPGRTDPLPSLHLLVDGAQHRARLASTTPPARQVDVQVVPGGSLPGSEWEPVDAFDQATGAWSFQWDATTLADAEWDLHLRIRQDATVVGMHVLTLNVFLNDAPTVDPVGPIEAKAKSPLVIVFTGSDPDEGQWVAWAATSLPEGATFQDQGDGTARFDWTPQPRQKGTHEFTVRVVDPLGAADDQAVTIHVKSPGGQ